MKIWMVNQYAIPPDRSGGTRHYSLARELEKSGHEVTIFASCLDYMKREQLPTFRDESQDYDGVKFCFINSSNYKKNGVSRVKNMISFSSNFLKVAQRKTGDLPDVIYGSSPSPFAAQAAMRLAKRFGIPFVLEIRDLWPETLVEVGGMSRFHPFVIWLSMIEKRLYKGAEKIVTLLEDAKSSIQTKVPEKKEILWIPNGISFDIVPEFKPAEEKECFELVYSGAHGIANDLGTIIDAATILSETRISRKIRFRLIGDGPEKEKLKSIAKERQLLNVIFEDPVPKREIYKRLQEADACIMLLKPTSLFDKGISPNKLFDYMSVGRPIIFSVSSSDNLVARYGCGMTVEAGDPEELAKAAVKLSTMTNDERTSMGLNGFSSVMKHNDMRILAKRLEAFLVETEKQELSEKKYL